MKILVGEDKFSRSCATTISAPAGQKYENILTFSVLRPEPQQLRAGRSAALPMREAGSISPHICNTLTFSGSW